MLNRKVPRVRGRVDIHIEVPRVDYEKLSSDRLGESSALIRERLQAVRERQRVRFGGTDIICNSDMRVGEVCQFCEMDERGTIKCGRR